MQTFLPYADFASSAFVLDDKRLGNQRNESITILETVVASTRFEKQGRLIIAGMDMGVYQSDTKRAWENHPATRMWVRWRWALLCYCYAINREWVRRGNSDDTRKKLEAIGFEMTQDHLADYASKNNVTLLPPWLGLDKFHASHRAQLLVKDERHYGKFGWAEYDGRPYYWPKG